MKVRLLLPLAVLAAGLLPLGAAAQEAGAPRYVMRHFDTPKGERDPVLLPEGEARALALVEWFEGKPVAAIFATPFRRTRASVTPLAEARGLVVESYDPADTAGLVARVRAVAGPVLIVGHSNTVPEIVAALGGEAPDELVHEDFGGVWTVTGGRTERAQVGR